jgi:hypothetical protein
MGACVSEAKKDVLEAERVVGSLLGVNVLPGLSFPKSFNALSRLALKGNVNYKAALSSFVKPEAEVLKWSIENLVGKPRTPENWNKLHEKMMSYMEISKQSFVPGYRHFPTDFSYGDVSMLAMHNSFVASFLSMKEKDGKNMPCISSLPEHGKAESFFQKFAQALSHEHYKRFTIWFDDDMKVISPDFWEFAKGEWVPAVIESEKDQLNQIIGTLGYVFECYHAGLHIFEAFITAAMFHAACANTELSYFIEPLIHNVLLKLDEVLALLVGPNAPAILSAGSHADRGIMLEVLVEWMKCFGHIKDEEDFVNNFIFAFIPAGAPIREKLLPEWRAQAALIPAYASAVHKKMESNGWIREREVEQTVTSFLDSCGTGFFSITTMNQWIQVQSLAALMHANTLSMTRTGIIEPYMAIVYPMEDNFTLENLINSPITAYGTIVEIIKDHHIFQPQHGCLDQGVTSVMREWQMKSEELKKAALVKYSADESLMKSYGWIVTDYFPDLYDHKQLTITTYV